MPFGHVKPKRPILRANPNPQFTSKRTLFGEFIEESGTNALLIDAVSKLYETVEKPENPLEWLRIYFRQQSNPRRSEEFEKVQDALREDIIMQETRLTHLQMEEIRLRDKLEELQYEAQELEIITPKLNHDEDFRRYRDYDSDPRWRIQPDPSVMLTKSDELVQLVENEKKLINKLSGLVSQISQSQTQLQEEETEVKETTSENKIEADAESIDDYNDYPFKYFGIGELPLEGHSIVGHLDAAGDEENNSEEMGLRKSSEEMSAEGNPLKTPSSGEFAVDNEHGSSTEEFELSSPHELQTPTA